VNVSRALEYRRSLTLATGVWYAAVAVGSTAVIWRGSGSLDHASERLAGYYGLPPVVRGAIVAAVGWIGLETVGVVGLLPVG
jgi:hypothetical protein